MGTSDDILNQISAEEARLAALREEADAATGRIRELRERLARRERAAAGKTPALPFAGKSAVPASQDEKVGLFRSLFRGREDVFPRLWESSKSGKKGYSPTCDNEWVRGLCLKPQVKCGDCPNQAFTPISDEVIRAHLVGKHVMGLYPLLQDETCFFLAADFDKKSWQDDVGTYVETCRSFGVEPAVERSRSGNGAHVWFFFEFPVSAASARRMVPSDNYTSRLTTITLPDRQRGDVGGVASEKSRSGRGRFSGASHGCSGEKAHGGIGPPRSDRSCSDAGRRRSQDGPQVPSPWESAIGGPDGA